MNRIVIVSIVAGILTIVGIATVVFGIFGRPGPGATGQSPAFDTATSGSNSQKTSALLSNACSILTEDIAKEFLGDKAIRVTIPAATVYDKDVEVSSCSYVAGTNGVSLILRIAKTQDGASGNKLIFTNSRPSGAEDVDGLGDDAYFDPSTKQLHVLKNTNWYIVTNYAKSPINASLDDNKRLAEKLSFQ